MGYGLNKLLIIGGDKMGNKIVETVKGVFKNYELTGLSTSFIGLSWEKVNSGDKEKALGELYLIRRRLSEFYFSYEDNFNRSAGGEDELLQEYFPKALEVHKDIAELVLNSKFFVQLPIEERNKFLSLFDDVTKKQVRMEYDILEVIEDEDIQTMVDDLLNLFEKIDEEITRLDNSR